MESLPEVPDFVLGDVSDIDIGSTATHQSFDMVLKQNV